jgi:hypothetical protein
MIHQKYASSRQSPHSQSRVDVVMPTPNHEARFVTRGGLYDHARVHELDYLTSFEHTMLECLKRSSIAVYRSSLTIVSRELIERQAKLRPGFSLAPKTEHDWRKEIRRIAHALDCIIV